MNSTLKATYYNPESPGSFGGVERLRKQTGGSKKAVQTWLKYQDAYTLHKPVRHNFPRRRTIVAGIRDQYQEDLIDVRKLKKDNDGNTYILTVIDVFSKMAFDCPLRNKTSTYVIPALQSIFDKAGRPHRLQTDNGSEFLNKLIC